MTSTEDVSIPMEVRSSQPQDQRANQVNPRLATRPLHKAVKEGQLSQVKEWLKHCGQKLSDGREAFDIDAQDQDGYTPFHLAVKHNHPEILALLAGFNREQGDAAVQIKADPHLCTEEKGFTALHLAAYCRQPCQRSLTGGTGHTGSASNGNREVLEFLVQKLKLNVNQKAHFDTYPLHVACSRGNRVAVEVLLEDSDINMELRDASEDSILHEVCTVGYVDILELLLEKLKENGQLSDMLKSKNNDHHTPLHVAYSYGHPKMAQKLLAEMKKNGEYDESSEENPPLLLACLQSDEAVFIEFLSIKGQKLTPKTNDGASILHIACAKNWKTALKEITDKEPSLLNQTDNHSRTPLHYATAHNRLEMVKLLIESRLSEGIEVDTPDEDGRSPYLVAASKGFAGVFGVLKDTGAVNLTRKDHSGKNSAFLAAESNVLTTLKTASPNRQLTASQSHDLADSQTDGQEEPDVFACVDMEGNTPVHAAASHGSKAALQFLLEEKRMKPNAVNFSKKTPLHLAAEHGHNDCVAMLVNFDGTSDNDDSDNDNSIDDASDNGVSDDDSDGEKDVNSLSEGSQSSHSNTSITLTHVDIVDSSMSAAGVDLMATDDDANTALHLAAKKGHTAVVDTLLSKNETELIGARNRILWTALNYAASEGHEHVVQKLLQKQAEVDTKDKCCESPLHLAAKRGHPGVVKQLLKNGADIEATNNDGANALDLAIENGHVGVAMVIVKSDGWRQVLRNVTKTLKGNETTPMRKLIRKMPDVAAEVLNRCTMANGIRPDHREYAVEFDFEFLEDFRNEPKTEGWTQWLQPSHYIATVVNRFTHEKKREKWCTTWGPRVFSKDRHPLNIMVQSGRTKLLDHPLVSRLIAFKWSRAWPLYLFNVLFYALFLFTLTAFALVLPNPQSGLCASVSNGSFGNASGSIECMVNFTGPQCGVCDARRDSLIAAGVIILFCVLARLLMELFQLLQTPRSYFLEYDNWVELTLYILTIIFLTTLGETCICPRSWQWQIGALAVFMAWIHLGIFIRKLPLFGLYIVMFESIVVTFLKIVIPAFLLVLAFGMAFYMVFSVPSPLFAASPFATPILSFFKAMTMSIGEVDFNDIFQLSSEGAANVEEVLTPIPYNVSFVLWIFFLVSMPILLMNLLTSLAVDDVGQIRSNAELRKLELQIELVLKTEEAFQILRWLFVIQRDKISPNQQSSEALRKIRSVLVTGVDDNFTADNIVKTLNKTPSEPIEYVLQHSSDVLDRIDKLTTSLREMDRKNQMMKTLLKKLAKKNEVEFDEKTYDDDDMCPSA